MERLRTFFADLTLRPQGFTIVIAAFLPIIAIVAMGPAVPTMIEHFAHDPEARSKVPAMIGAPGLAMALLAPFAGVLADRFGRRRLLLISTLLYGVFGSAPLLLDDLDHIFWSRVLLGVSEAGILTVVNTLIGDYWDDKGRRNWLFLQGLLGPLLAGVIALIVGYASSLQWNGVFFVYLIAFPIWAAMVVWLFEPSGQKEAGKVAAAEEAATPFPWANALAVGAVTLFCSLIYYVFIINGALVFAEVGVADPKVYAATIFIPQFFVLAGAAVFRLLAGTSNAFQLLVFFVLVGIGLGGMGLATSAATMALFLCLQQTAVGMVVPTLIAWAQTKFSFAHRGRGMGIWSAAFFLGQSQSPRIVHLVDAQAGSMQGAFAIAGMVALAAGCVALAIAVMQRRAA